MEWRLVFPVAEQWQAIIRQPRNVAADRGQSWRRLSTPTIVTDFPVRPSRRLANQNHVGTRPVIEDHALGRVAHVERFAKHQRSSDAVRIDH